ncbi:MAG: hypothetical protein ACR2G5_15885, partial [Pyrinomonadaceae bacterium]
MITGIIAAIILFTFASPAAGRELLVQDVTQTKPQPTAQQKTEAKALEDPEAESQPSAASKAKKKLSFTYNGEITNYFISETSAFFGDSARHWFETSLRLDGTVRYKNFNAGFSGLGIKTTGRDSYGTGTTPASAPAGTSAPGTLPSFYLDKVYVQLDRIAGLPLKATLGRQHITIG